MEKEKVYFEENNIIIEKKKKIRKYPIAKLRYKRNTFVYKNPAFAPADGRRKEEFLELYYNRRIIAIINSDEYELGDLIRNYNLKIFSESGVDGFIYLKKSLADKLVPIVFIGLGIIALPVYILLWTMFYTSIKYNMLSIAILIFALMLFCGYIKSNCKIFFNEEQILLKYLGKNKIYNYEQIVEYNVVQSYFNNKLETLIIWFDDGEEIRVTEEYENFSDFFKILNDKAYSSYM